MSLKHMSSAGSFTTGVVCLLGLMAVGGCASNAPHGEASSVDSTPVATSEQDRPEMQPQTDTQALADLPDADSEGTTTVMADAGAALKASAPKNYVVKRGDTLWGIANMFLRDPWAWPEIWYVNPEIHNPHLIYPGDTVHLALSRDGRTALQLVRGNGQASSRLEPMLRSSPLESAIPTIPYSVISAFLERPGVLSRDEVRHAPYILSLRGEHDIAGARDEVYIKKLDGQVTGARYSVMHVDQPLEDRDGGRHLGYLAIYTGTAQLTQTGAIAKATITDSERETLQGDVLVAEEPSPSADFRPHPPARPVHGEIVAVVEGEDLAGQFDVVALNRGARDGLERGNVLTIDEVPVRTDDQCAHINDNATCYHHSSVQLPTEFNGTLLVFKTYDEMSYALILNDLTPVRTYDHFRNP